MALTAITGNSSSQTSTQSPQVSGASQSGNSGNLQPGITGSLLNSSNGVPLQNPDVLTVPLGSATSQTTTSVSPPAPAHHFDAALLSLPIILMIIAAASIWFTNRSVNNTTKYL